MTRPLLHPLVEEVAAEALALALVLGQAEAIQWEASPTPKPREDTSERSKGGHSDPTLNTVADDRRLAVRAAVVEGLDQLSALVQVLRDARTRAAQAMERWEGR